MSSGLVVGFVENQNLWIGIFISSLDALGTGLKNDAIQFSFEVDNILEQLIFFAMVVSGATADEPPRVDVMEFALDEALNIPFEGVGLLYYGFN